MWGSLSHSASPSPWGGGCAVAGAGAIDSLYPATPTAKGASSGSSSPSLPGFPCKPSCARFWSPQVLSSEHQALCGPWESCPEGSPGGPLGVPSRGVSWGPWESWPEGSPGEPLGGEFLLSGPLSPIKTKPALLNRGMSSSFLATWGITKTDGTSPGTCAHVRWQSH